MACTAVKRLTEAQLHLWGELSVSDLLRDMQQLLTASLTVPLRLAGFGHFGCSSCLTSQLLFKFRRMSFGKLV